MGNYSGLGDSKTRRQEESIVEQVEMRSYYWAGRQIDRKTGGEHCGTAREEEMLQS
jgi:hypothetical protein